jgi:MoaA/NifB/PqqE/SkfB family radical SAM enzyme
MELKNEKVFEKKEAIFEKRKWVGLTNKCNNHCIFCLDGDIEKRFHKSLEEIKEEFDSGIKEGCTRLVLSGGEATIHPNFIEIIKMGKKAGYKKIQVISNGRMFSYRTFINKAISAGINEITFSIHGHNSELHDSLTSIKGSFEQTVNGIKNALKKRIIVNCDIVINKKNVKYFPEIIDFLLELGVREFDLLHIMPYGNTWKNKDNLLYSFEENASFLKKGIEIGKSRGAVIWTNRFPPEYLEGYEEYIQDPYKLLDEIAGRKKEFLQILKENKRLNCYGERCDFCCMKELCEFLFLCNSFLKQNKNTEERKDDEIIITKKNFSNLDYNLLKIRNKKDLILTLVPPSYDYKDYSNIVPRIENALEKVYPFLESTNCKLKNIPPCFIEQRYRERVLRDTLNLNKDFITKGEIDLNKCTLHFIGNKKIKGKMCGECKLYTQCDGLFQKYIMIYGFKEIKPIK